MKYPETAMRLRKAIEAKNLTPQELSNKSGVSKGSISLYLSGQNEPKTKNAGKMAKVLEVSPMYLMGFDVEIIEAAESGAKRTKSIAEINTIMNEVNDEQLKRLLAYAQFIKERMGGDE